MPAKSIKDVARLADVSIATVSRVLNDNERVKPELRARVLQVMEEMQYVPSGIARNMRRQSQKSIGLVIADIQNPFFTDIVRAIEDVAYRNRFTVLLGSSDGRMEKERLYLDLLTMERVSGFILVPVAERPDIYNFNQPMPLVFIDRAVPDIAADAVVLDNMKGGYDATEHLLQLGHTRIGLITTPESHDVGRQRRAGYEQALRAHGLRVTRSLIRTGGLPKERGGYHAAVELLAMRPRPTALLAVNNVRTIGMLQAVKEAGLRIPEDISVIGFDDSPWLSLLTPPMTTVSQPVYEIGAEATRRLIGRITGELDAPPTTVVLPPTLLVRESTAPPR